MSQSTALIKLADPRLPDRFWRKVRPTASGCWEWIAALNDSGYGRYNVAKSKPRGAHRVAYETLVESLPEDLVLDHLCRNRCCCNPEHLEPVTRQVNNRRGHGWSGIHAAATHCSAGHPYAGANLRVRKSGRRACRACELERNRAVRAARREAA